MTDDGRLRKSEGSVNLNNEVAKEHEFFRGSSCKRKTNYIEKDREFQGLGRRDIGGRKIVETVGLYIYISDANRRIVDEH